MVSTEGAVLSSSGRKELCLHELILTVFILSSFAVLVVRYNYNKDICNGELFVFHFINIVIMNTPPCTFLRLRILFEQGEAYLKNSGRRTETRDYFWLKWVHRGKKSCFFRNIFNLHYCLYSRKEIKIKISRVPILHYALRFSISPKYSYSRKMELVSSGVQ